MYSRAGVSFCPCPSSVFFPPFSFARDSTQLVKRVKVVRVYLFLGGEEGGGLPLRKKKSGTSKALVIREIDKKNKFYFTIERTIFINR